MDENKVVELMKSSKSEQEWNKNCNTVRKSHGGAYPTFWYKAIVLSGVSGETAAKWGDTDQIEIIIGERIGAGSDSEKGSPMPMT